MGVKVVKAGKSYIDRADKRVTESPTHNPYLFKFGHAMCLPISATTVLASELIEGWMIDYLREVFVCANQRSEHHPPALICGFSGGKKNITFFFRKKHSTRKNTSVS